MLVGGFFLISSTAGAWEASLRASSHPEETFACSTLALTLLLAAILPPLYLVAAFKAKARGNVRAFATQSYAAVFISRMSAWGREMTTPEDAPQRAASHPRNSDTNPTHHSPAARVKT